MPRWRHRLPQLVAFAACVGAAAFVAEERHDDRPAEDDRLPAQARSIVGDRSHDALGDGVTGLVRWNGGIVARGRVARRIDLQTNSFQLLGIAGIGEVIDVAEAAGRALALVRRSDSQPLVLVMARPPADGELAWEGHDLPDPIAFPYRDAPTVTVDARGIVVSGGGRSFVLLDEKWVEQEPPAAGCRLGAEDAKRGTLEIAGKGGEEATVSRPASAWDDGHFRARADGHVWDLGSSPVFHGTAESADGRLLATVAGLGIVRHELDGEWTWLTPGWPNDEVPIHVLEHQGALVVATAARTVAVLDPGATKLRWIRPNAGYERSSVDPPRVFPLVLHETQRWAAPLRERWPAAVLGPTDTVGMVGDREWQRSAGRAAPLRYRQAALPE